MAVSAPNPKPAVAAAGKVRVPSTDRAAPQGAEKRPPTTGARERGEKRAPTTAPPRTVDAHDEGEREADEAPAAKRRAIQPSKSKPQTPDTARPDKPASGPKPGSGKALGRGAKKGGRS